jgi:3',5'-nucleoside bisphosphate phosphatase
MIDLQLHTTDSDGTWPWDTVLNACGAMGLTAFAITDHDTVVRRNEIQVWAEENKKMAIPGIELSTCEKDQTVHLLGYFLEGPLDKLETQLSFLQEARKDRNSKIIRKLQELGLDLTEEDLRRVAGKATVGRPHLARVLMEKGYVQTIKEAFDRYLGITGSAYFPKEEIPLREGIDLLHDAGAVTSVAHPMLLHRFPETLEASFKEWRSWGLDGLESIYPTYQPEQTAFMKRVAQKYKFLLTGGSDFHGENKPHIKIGTGTGELNVPDELIAPLVERKNEIVKSLSKTIKN